ncbi:hypothetical protein CMI37_15080 [Candidatus Pacearchaeota archaeon]|nr:hypothetical protein [Candidatus Pacearchaeota archaeon]|tara:strand:- start:1802 stop:2152 length:351 start_codon:yes stop_codon:yes gene_type:complete
MSKRRQQDQPARKKNDKKTALRRNKFLGMSYSTAFHRLRKSIMLMLLRRLDANWCYRCGGEIKTERELSIDHKKSWFNVSVELFWDLDNIAFSHLSCNSRNKPIKENNVNSKNKSR